MRRRFLFLSLSVLLIAMAGLWAGCSRNQASSPVDLGSSFSKGDLTAPESGRIHTQIALRGHLDATASAEGCENNPGPFITLNGELSLGGINGRLIFRNNERGTHEHIEDTTVDIVLLNEGRTIRFAKQPPEGGVGGNPWIWIQFFDGSWNPISSPTVLGRCVQGLSATSLDFGLLTDAEALVTTGDCDNSGGPNITLTGELVLGGINAKLYFTNNAKWTHWREEPTQVSLVILPEGESITFAKQPPQDGAGGNPRIYFQFAEPNGSALSSEFYLGRCVQLGR